MNDTASVYEQVGRLCASLIKESSDDVEKDENLSVNSAKRIAFEILLKTNVGEVPDNEKLLQELQFASFELSLAKKNKESKQINQVIEKIGDKSPEFLQVCWLLLQLKNIDPDPDSKHQVRQSRDDLWKSIQNISIFRMKRISLRFLRASSNWRGGMFTFKAKPSRCSDFLRLLPHLTTIAAS